MKKIKSCIQNLYFLMVTICFSNYVAAQADSDLKVVFDKTNNLSQLVEITNEGQTVIYSTNNILKFPSYAFDTSHIAFVVVNREIEKPETNPSPLFNHKLVILNDSHVPVAEIEEVHRYNWSPSGLQIAYIIGEDKEYYPGFVPTQLQIIDVAEKNKTMIPFVSAYDIQWTAHDQNIYLQADKNVFVFNPSNNTLKETSYKGIYFSPNGEYYYLPSYDGGIFSLYKSSANERIIPSILLQNDLLNPIGWLNHTNCIIIRGDQRNHVNIINVENGKSVDIKKELFSSGNGYISLDVLDDEKDKTLKELDVILLNN